METVIKITTITRNPVFETPIDRNPHIVLVTTILHSVAAFVTTITRQVIKITRILQ